MSLICRNSATYNCNCSIRMSSECKRSHALRVSKPTPTRGSQSLLTADSDSRAGGRICQGQEVKWALRVVGQWWKGGGCKSIPAPQMITLRSSTNWPATLRPPYLSINRETPRGVDASRWLELVNLVIGCRRCGRKILSTSRSRSRFSARLFGENVTLFARYTASIKFMTIYVFWKSVSCENFCEIPTCDRRYLNLINNKNCVTYTRHFYNTPYTCDVFKCRNVSPRYFCRLHSKA